MRNLKLITIREYLAKVKNKSFITMTFVSPLIMVGMFLLVFYLIGLNNNKTTKIAFLDESGLFQNQLKSDHSTAFIDFSTYSKATAIDSTQSGDYLGLLYIPKLDATYEGRFEFYTDKSPDSDLLNSIEHQLATAITENKLKDSEIDVHKIEQAQTVVDLKLESFSGERTSKSDKYIKMVFGGGAGYLLFMFIIIYGNMVMRSVIEEKTSRIIEIIISSVKPLQLMWGKILGTTFAGITQFLIWIFFGGLLLIIAGSFLDLDVSHLPSQPMTGSDINETTQIVQEIFLDVASLPLLELVICFLIYFIGGYFLYSAIYAAIGAAVDNETDTQQFIFPTTLPLMLGMYVGFFSVMGDPHGTVAVIFSYIPFTSPIVMLMRIPFGVAWWEVGLSIAVLFASIFLIAWIGAKIYRIGILMYGKKPTYKELVKWLKY